MLNRLVGCDSTQPGLELLKREAGSKLTQPGVSAAPTRHSLTSSRVKENIGSVHAAFEFGERVRRVLLKLNKDTRRGSLGSWRRPSRWNSPETRLATSHTFIFLLTQLSFQYIKLSFRLRALDCVKHSHLAVGEVKVVTHLHRQRSPAAAAEIHDAVLAASVWHVIDCEHSLTCRVSLKETKKELEESISSPQSFILHSNSNGIFKF